MPSRKSFEDWHRDGTCHSEPNSWTVKPLFSSPVRQSQNAERDHSGEEGAPTAFQPSFQMRVHQRAARNAGVIRRCKEEDGKNARGQNTQKAGSDPTLDGFEPPKPLWGRSRPVATKR